MATLHSISLKGFFALANRDVLSFKNHLDDAELWKHKGINLKTNVYDNMYYDNKFILKKVDRVELVESNDRLASWLLIGENNETIISEGISYVGKKSIRRMSNVEFDNKIKNIFQWALIDLGDGSLFSYSNFKALLNSEYSIDEIFDGLKDNGINAVEALPNQIIRL